MSSLNSKSARTVSTVALVALGTLVAGPVLLSAAPASAATHHGAHHHTARHQVKNGGGQGQGSITAANGSTTKMHIDDAQWSSHGGRGNLQVMLGSNSSYTEASIKFVGGKVVGGNVESPAGKAAVTGGSINSGKGIAKNSRIVLQTSSGTIVMNLNVR